MTLLRITQIAFSYCWNGAAPVTVIPMLRAVPATIFMADSRVNAFRSVILSSAIFCTCSQLTLKQLYSGWVPGNLSAIWLLPLAEQPQEEF